MKGILFPEALYPGANGRLSGNHRRFFFGGLPSNAEKRPWGSVMALRDKLSQGRRRCN